MALTRALLKGMGITDEQISGIIEAHAETVDAIKKQRDDYKTKADGYDKIKKELDDLKKDGGSWEQKYKDEHKAFEEFKDDHAKKDKIAGTSKKFRELLTKVGVSDQAIDAVINATKIEELELDDKGEWKDEKSLTESINKKWGGFIKKESKEGANTQNPPSQSGGKNYDIYKKNDKGRYVMSTSQRQEAIAKQLMEES